MNDINFEMDDWGGWMHKADQPGKEFVVNGVRCTLYSVEGRDPSWDGKPLFAIVLRREDRAADQGFVQRSSIPVAS